MWYSEGCGERAAKALKHENEIYLPGTRSAPGAHRSDSDTREVKLLVM